MRKVLLLVLMLLTLAFPVWCQNPFNVAVTSVGTTNITTNIAASLITVQQISGTPVAYTVTDACLPGGHTTVVGPGAPYTFTGATCGAGYATTTTAGTVRLSSGTSVNFRVYQTPKTAPSGATTCAGLSDAGTGCPANAGTGPGTYAAGNDSRITSAVPNTRQVAGHALSGDVTLSASDVGLGNVTNDTQAKAATTVCGHALSSNVSCTPSDVGAVPTTQTVNGHALSGPVAVTASDVGLGNVNNSDATNGSNIASGKVALARIADFPDVKFIPAANCNNATAGDSWGIGSGGTVSCRTGTNNFGGFVVITDTSSTFATFQVVIPEDWNSGTNPWIRFQIASTDATNGHTVIPSIQVACYKGDGSTTDDVAPNAAHSLSTVTLNGNANRFWSSSNVQMNSTDMTGCVAGALMQVTVGRATDTATNAKFYGATITFPRTLVAQAN